LKWGRSQKKVGEPIEGWQGKGPISGAEDTPAFLLSALVLLLLLVLVLAIDMYTPAPIIGPYRAAKPLVYTLFWRVPFFQ
jgi:hypothetical protein